MTAVIQIVGYKNAGKTTLIERLVRKWTAEGLKVGTVKHDAHRFDVDREGTDTWRHRQAGAFMTAIASAERTALIMEAPVRLDEILRRMEGLDVVLVEGFKQEAYPKVAIIRSEEDVSLPTQLTQLVAIVSWLPALEAELPVFPVGAFDELSEWLKRLFPESATNSSIVQ
jgi:molybdopterin-guanine dinucleotide biosynthesis protein B